MQGSLVLRHGVLYVGRHEQTAHVRPYDLDGAPLGAGFDFRAEDGGPARVDGLDVDAAHQIWVADGANACVRSFSVFGQPTGKLEGQATVRPDAYGSLRDVRDVCLSQPLERPAGSQTADSQAGAKEEPLLCYVAMGGRRRHAVQVFELDGTPGGTARNSLRPLGDPEGAFVGVGDVSVHTNGVVVCETTGGRMQIFQNGDFHYAVRVAMAGNERFRPTAAALLEDGRLLVTHAGETSAVLMLDSSGRLLKVLAESGQDTGCVTAPGDLAVEATGLGQRNRLAVIDRDAERVQVFTLEGRCYGAIEDLPGQAL